MPFPRPADWKTPPRGIGGWWLVLGLMVVAGLVLAGMWIVSRHPPTGTTTQPLVLPASAPQPEAEEPDPIPVLPEQTGWLYRHQTSAATQSLVASVSLAGQGKTGAPAPQVGVVFTAATRRAQVFLQNMEGVTSCQPPTGCLVVVQERGARHEWKAVANQGLLVFPDAGHNQAFLLLLSSPSPEAILVMDVAVLGGWQAAHFSSPALEKEKLGLTAADLQADAALLLGEQESEQAQAPQAVDALVQAKQAAAAVFDLELGKKLQIKRINGCLPSPEYPARAQVQVDENGLPRKYEKQWETQEGTARKVVYYDANGNTRQAVLMSRDPQTTLFKLRARTYLDASGVSLPGAGQDLEMDEVPVEELAEDPWKTMEAISGCATVAKAQQAPTVSQPASQDFAPVAVPQPPMVQAPENTVEVFLPAQPAPESSPAPVRNP